ncbi:hypothetical protein DYH10_01185 [Candidatus Saccharibacteria bacterium CPR2]|nr:hypothetical protein [Candidatus Saccharibacteria bacterium CPR2]
MTIKDKLKVHSITGATTVAGVLALSNGVSAQCDPSSGSIGQGVQCAKPKGAAEELFGDGSIFQTITNALLFLVGAISVVMLIVGGVRYVVSAGDQNAVQGAKNTILYAIVGIVVAFLAFAAVNWITTSLAEGS